jgi:hypothetical protein
VRSTPLWQTDPYLRSVASRSWSQTPNWSGGNRTESKANPEERRREWRPRICQGGSGTVFEQTFKNIDDILHKDAGCTSELDYTEQSSWLLFLKYLDALEGDKANEAALEGKR